MAVTVITHNSCAKAVFDGALSGSHALKAALTNTLPTAAQIVLDLVTAHAPPTGTSGYPVGGYPITLGSNATVSTSQAQASANRITPLAAGGTQGPFQYLVVYDSSNANILMFSVDLGGAVTLTGTQSKSIDWSGTNPGVFLSTV